MIENGGLATVDDLLNDGVLVAIGVDGHHLAVAAAWKRVLVRVSSCHSSLLWLLEADNKEEKNDNQLKGKES